MENKIFWKQLSQKPQIYIFDTFQIYANEDLYDTFIDETLGKLMSNTIPDIKKEELMSKLSFYLVDIAEKHDYKDILKILHSNIKIFSIANIGLQAGVNHFKKDFIIETIIPLFESYFEKPLGSKDNWCIYKDGCFDFKNLIHYCIALSKENYLEELTKLITIFITYLDKTYLKYTYLYASKVLELKNILENEPRDYNETKIKYLLSCLGVYYETNNYKKDKMLDFIEFYQKNLLIAMLDLGDIFSFNEIIKNSIFISGNMTPLSRCFYVSGIYLIEMMEKTAFMDYSISSMQFYKVIENELKDKVINPVFCNVDFQSLKEHPFKTIKNLESITLGNIRYIFEWLLHDWDNKVVNSDLDKIKNVLKQKFNDDKRYVEEINILISQHNLNKYRNPPAHVKTLEFDKAAEAYYSCILFMYIITLVGSNYPYISLINKSNTPYLFE